MKKVRMESRNLIEDNIERIGEIFPNVITEIKDNRGGVRKSINFEKLKEELIDVISSEKEMYEFSWPGKKEALRTAFSPVKKALRPDVASSSDWNNTSNLYIEGDNLESMKLLRESYLGKINIIYIDPPYNRKNERIYRDDFSRSRSQENTEAGINDEFGNHLVKNPESDSRFHSNWCNMIYPRLLVARDLLADDGVIYISIDDKELGNTIKICNEIFGEQNYIASFPRLTTKSGKTPSTVMISNDYVLCYVKHEKNIFVGKAYSDSSYKFSDEFEKERGKYNLKQPLDCNSISYSQSLDYPIEHDGITYYPGSNYDKYVERKRGNYTTKDYAWRWSKEKYEFGLKNGWIVFQNGRIYTKGYLRADIQKQSDGKYHIVSREKTRTISTIDLISNEYSNDMGKKQFNSLQIPVNFDNPKPVQLIKELISSYYRKNPLIMDFFSGSGTTGEAVYSLNSEDGGKRNFILIQVPETVEDMTFPTICHIGKERLRVSGYREKQTDESTNNGFRVLKLDSSNYRDVYHTTDYYQQNLLSFSDSNIKEDRTDLDLLFGCLLDWGLELSKSYESEEISGVTIHTYDEDALIACFAENISEEVIREIAKRQPLRVVFRDSSFESDAARVNVSEIFKLQSPGTDVRVI